MSLKLASLSNPSAAPQTASTWPVNNDVPDLLAIVQAQAATIADNAALIDRYQDILATAQAVPPAHGTGVASAAPNGTTLTMTSVTGKIALGATVTGSGVSANTTITGQQAGTPGGNGTYTTNIATTAAGSALTFTPGGGTMPWPMPQDPPTLMALTQSQSALMRNQTAILQQYQDVLNISEVPAA